MDLIRDIDPLLLAEYQKPIFYPITLVYVDAPAGALYLHTGVGELSFDGETWLGLGGIGNIDVPPETGGGVPESATLSIAGPAELMYELADDQNTRGRSVDIYAGCTTKPGGVSLIGVPDRVFTGRMGESSFKLDEGRSNAQFAVSVTSGISVRSGEEIVHSDEEHQAKYPGDTMFRRVANATQWSESQIKWPE